ncbi:UDP-N-acetylglucosamine--N-acetylmuramyl-(pentapeptide) pyrophosphoryl-undecaprenol N-acetylglucosamine transferase [Dyadobacter arcticus]|uniref:UDP-N-acetylglucosamine:LPS N-acetylglucosamine transferase n=1 Tax=Dyadobacter arcticus TaxID=1078754 RepID=A0ABX0UR25_9BACT|nr:UDP-N-acetylglucosamine--N-acetylmuramyl-(pentapeptide) pyrophosphoryl-undecaprenol N-acetylglucosamine transferase [Dyadobacter arcticus]NIJ55444.1 UDP-N-acetylglucosamine:LPS N-acetylglucosamine transferase [Dyadobacter arcticus]
MKKPTIFYFVHAHGNGHRATFNMLYPALSVIFKVIVITTNSEITGYLHKKHDVQVLELPPKYPTGYEIPQHTFSKAFEVTPYAIGPAGRAKALTEAIERYQPKAFYCDGVPELAIMVRGMGVPVVLVHLPGNVMSDPTQVFAHELADHIVAHFHSSLEQANYQFASKTYYSGYMSQYSGCGFKRSNRSDISNITVLLGYNNYDESVLKNITKDQNTQFTIIGNKRDYDLDKNCILLGPVKDISEAIVGEVVISAAGQNTIAELLSLDKRMVLLPEPRPYDEQVVHANVLASQNVALLAQEIFSAEQWQNLLQKAKVFTPFYKNLVNASAPEEIAQKMRNWYA